MKNFIISIICLLSFLSLQSYTKIGVIGDSISCPSYVNYYEGWPYLLHEHYDIPIVNWSVGGSYTDSILDRIEHMVVEEEPDLFIITVGINSALSQWDIGTVYSQYANAITYLRNQEIDYIIGACDTSYLTQIPHPYRVQFPQLYTWLGANFPGSPIWGFINYTRTTNPIYWTVDNFHTNSLGHAEIADELINIINVMMEE